MHKKGCPSQDGQPGIIPFFRLETIGTTIHFQDLAIFSKHLAEILLHRVLLGHNILPPIGWGGVNRRVWCLFDRSRYQKCTARPSISRTLPYSTSISVKYFLTEFFLDIVKYLLLYRANESPVKFLSNYLARGMHSTASLEVWLL